MSAPCPSTRPGVSTSTGEPAAAHTATTASGSMCPSVRLACRSAPEPKASREPLACTRSIRPVMALTRSTRSTSSSPPAWAWQVSRQKPGPNSPTASHSRAIRSSRRAIALSPPAVFSIRIGSGNFARSNTLRQLSKPTWGSSPSFRCPPCTIRPLAPSAAAAAACWSRILRLGIRILLFVVATLTR